MCLGWEVQGSISGNIRRFHFAKHNKSFPLRKYDNSFNIRARQFHSPTYKEFWGGMIFFVFRESGYITAGAVHLDTPFEGFVFPYSKLISYWFDCLEK